jgi:hypothetical protein
LKKYLLVISLLLTAFIAKSQTLESIHFNLYTDSLKKGMYNYINVIGKYNNGRYLPLTAKELDFTTSYGKFVGTELLIPWDYKVDSAVITATLKSNKAFTKTTVIYIKKLDEAELKMEAAPTAPIAPKETKKSKKKKKKS